MPLIDAGVTLAQLTGYRMCWIPGAFSSGKSALSFRLAYELAVRKSYRIVCNQESVWNEGTPPDFDSDMKLKLVAIIDEGGLYLSDNAQLMSWMAFAGKMDLVAVVPSIQEPASILSTFTIQKAWGWRAAGLPFDAFRWDISMRKVKYSGLFYWLGMEEIYGVYSTLNPSIDPLGLISWLQRKVDEYKRYYMDRQKVPSWLEEETIRALAEQAASANGRGKRGKAVGIERGTIELLSDKVAKISEEVDRFEAISKRTSKGWRR